jgi:hypothetical protein
MIIFLDNISNTPRYWQTVRNELIAKLENVGPFHFFDTLSCADMRWDENFSSSFRSKVTWQQALNNFLTENNLRMTYEPNEWDDFESIVIHDDNDPDSAPQSLDDYLEKKIGKSRHEFIRQTVLTATRNFNHRVKMFYKHIVMGKDNPMAVRFYNFRIEFQGKEF